MPLTLGSCEILLEAQRATFVWLRDRPGKGGLVGVLNHQNHLGMYTRYRTKDPLVSTYRP